MVLIDALGLERKEGDNAGVFVRGKPFPSGRWL
jgi:hypothetical protein